MKPLIVSVIKRTRLRVVVLAGIAFLVVATVAVVVLAVVGVLRPFQATVLVGLAGTFAVASVATVLSLRTLITLQRTQRRIARAIKRMQKPDAPIVAAVKAESADVRTAIIDLATQHQTKTTELTERYEASHREQLKQISRGELQLYWQLEALLDLRVWTTLRAPLPPMRGWAASPDVLLWMLTWARHHKPEFIVECGSGVSTILFGYHMQSTGSGKVVSLEHDPRFAMRTRDLAQQHGVADVIEVRDAPLRAWHEGGRTWDWYDPSVVDDIAEIDLLFIDGPPSTTAGLARYPAGPLLFSKLAPGGIAVLDDTLRDDERRASQLWLEQIEGLERERLKTDKGTDVFRCRAD